MALVAEPREARMLARAYKSWTTNHLVVRSRGSRARRISMLPHSDMRTAVCQPSPRAGSTRRLKAGSSSDRRAQLTGRRTHLAWLAQTSSALPVPHELARCQSLWHAVQHSRGVLGTERDMRAIGSVREVCEPMWTSSDWSVPGALRRACDPQLAPSAVGIGVSVRRG